MKDINDTAYENLKAMIHEDIVIFAYTLGYKKFKILPLSYITNQNRKDIKFLLFLKKQVTLVLFMHQKTKD